jgi:hypothetical protein
MISHSARQRADGWWFVGFVVLVLIGSAFVSLPDSADPPAKISAFYDAHRTAVVVTQLFGLVGSVILLRVLAVLRSEGGPGGRALMSAGVLVVVTNVLTAVPILVLAFATGLGPDGTSSAAKWADVADDALFCAIALFAGTIAVGFRLGWLRNSAGVVAVLCAIRGVGGPLGLTAVDVVAPLSFLLLMLAIGMKLLVRPGPLSSTDSSSANLDSS